MNGYLLDDGYPIQCVTAWIGNSPKIAQRHYLMVTEEHFRRASEAPDRGYKKQCNTCKTEGDSENPKNEKTLFLKGSDTASHLCENRVMETIGLEPTTPALQKRCSPS